MQNQKKSENKKTCKAQEDGLICQCLFMHWLMWDVTCTEPNVSPQPAALEARRWSPDSYSLPLRSENIIFKLCWYFLQCTVQNYSLAFPRVLCHFPELITLREFVVYTLHFLHFPISCQDKRIKRRPQVHNRQMSPGALTTQTAVISWNLKFWREKDLDVLNNKILQTANERQLWKGKGNPWMY